MKKRKLLTILAAILAISLMGLSATCQAPGESPAIELDIYDGPVYSESDDMCYYRVEAIVAGMPEPEIEFDVDDNVELLGSSRVEVGVKAGDSYTLTATATNTQGTASVSIILKGECSKGVPDEETADADEDSDGDSDDDADTEKETPTISLEVYEGPFPIESICVYRVKAIVTGSPNPTISFSKDDSGGSWGTKKAQVNLNNPGDTYTLTATATNSEGSATDSIMLSWGCEIPEPEPIEDELNKVADPSLSGYIIVDRGAYGGLSTIIGDWTTNKPVKAYLSFNISSIGALDDITIKDVSVTIPIDDINNNPELAGSEVHIKVYDYGDSLDYPAEQGIGGELVKTISATDSLTNLNFSSNKLEDELQKAVDIEKQWFQLKIGLSGVSSDGVRDWYRVPIANVVLHVKYEIPG